MKHAVYIATLLLLRASLPAAADDTVAVITVSVYLDDTLPGPSMTSTIPAATNTSPILVAVQFTEPVLGFEPEDVVVSNALLDDFQGADADFSFRLTPLAEGLVTADIPAGRARDVAGNFNTAAPQFARFYDITPPTGALSINDGDVYSRIIAVDLTLNADDGDGAGVADVALRNTGTDWSEWAPWTSPMPWTLEAGQGYKTVQARYRDTAGNVSVTDIADTIALDTEPLVLVLIGDTVVNKKEDESHTFEVSAFGTFGTPSYQWYKEDAPAKEFLAIPGANAPTYTIDQLAAGDSGTYYCEASDETETAQSPEVPVEIGSNLHTSSSAGLILAAAVVLLAGVFALLRRHRAFCRPTIQL